MLRFLTDEDFDGRFTSALLSRLPGLVPPTLDAIVAWMEANGKRPDRFGPKGISRADALRDAVERTVRAIQGRANEKGAWSLRRARRF
jgi:hypothetical protein